MMLLESHNGQIMVKECLRLNDGFTNERRRAFQMNLTDSEFSVFRLCNDLKEFNDTRLKSQIGHVMPAKGVESQHAIRARAPQFGFRFIVIGPRDDEEIVVQIAC